jgi:23S rRNA (pseudouridine1915-N3)-methyltransferase
MTIVLLNTGKTDNENLRLMLEDYSTRINRFTSFKIDNILLSNSIGKFKPEEVKRAEGDLISKKLTRADYIILLDEQGKKFNSVNFAQFLQKQFNAGYKNIYFVTGGAYGFSPEVYAKAHEKLSLSYMTTTHQLIRLFFTEQLYRAFTILNNHPYHNE